MGWFEFFFVFLVFLLSHSIPARPKIRNFFTHILGERTYLIIYGLVSLGLLIWLIVAAGRAPYIELWSFQEWHTLVPNIIVPAVCLLFCLTLGVPNALSFGGSNNGLFNAEFPASIGLTRHPLLWCFLLWSTSHVVVNGDLAHALLFGFFGVFSALGMVIVDRKKQRLLGMDGWRLMSKNAPLLLSLYTKPDLMNRAFFTRIVAGIALYALLYNLHEATIGVSPAIMLWK